MNSLLRTTRNWLCVFSGEDCTIIQICSIKIQNYFSIIGLIVLIIMLCSLASSIYFTNQLFDSIFANISIGATWGYIITNMYLLFLYTITPALLPTKVLNKELIKPREFQLSFSMGLRISILILLAIIIAQPLNVLILKPKSTALAFDIKYLLTSNPFAIIITIIVIFIFLLPIYLKYSIRKLGEFYEKKAIIKKLIIEDDYKEFKKEYKQIIESNIVNYNESILGNLMPFLNKLEKTNLISYQKNLAQLEKELKTENVEKYEYWENPPYRTIHKSRVKNILTETDLLKQIYPDSN
jgi:hypothetical protein